MENDLGKKVPVVQLVFKLRHAVEDHLYDDFIETNKYITNSHPPPKKTNLPIRNTFKKRKLCR
jgi:hypothetical protein